MLLEGRQTIPLSQVKNAHIDFSRAKFFLFNVRFFCNERDFWKSTDLIVSLMCKLFDTEGDSNKIRGYSHKDCHYLYDLLELYSPLYSNTLGLFCAEDGETKFALRGESVSSTNTQFGDAQLIAKFLGEFASKAESKVKIEGPTEEEPLVVMTTPQAASIGNDSEHGGIIGVVFKPVVEENNGAVHGTTQLLVREKPKTVLA